MSPELELLHSPHLALECQTVLNLVTEKVLCIVEDLLLAIRISLASHPFQVERKKKQKKTTGTSFIENCV